MLRQSSRAVNAAVDATVALLDGGALRIFDGPRPTSPDVGVPLGLMGVGRGVWEIS